MTPYLNLLRHVLAHGTAKPTRAVLPSTGERISAISVFGTQTRYDLSAGFPLVTTKRVPFKAVAHELLWFMSGSTNAKDLQKHGVTIWDEWTPSDGDLGPTYGKQWRQFSGATHEGDLGVYDQIEWLIRAITGVAKDPYHPWARRLLLTAWNPCEVGWAALPPCHVLAQFDVTDGRLSCQLYQRSADLFLGVPFNIASYALLTQIFARSAGLAVGDLIHTIGDAHVYANHVDQVREQLTREPLPLPTLEFAADAPLDPLAIRYEHLRLVGYHPLGKIHGEVAV